MATCSIFPGCECAKRPTPNSRIVSIIVKARMFHVDADNFGVVCTNPHNDVITLVGAAAAGSPHPSAYDGVGSRPVF